MKKSKLLVLGLIALMLAGGLALASCGSKCVGDGKCYAAGDGGYGKDCGDGCIANQAAADARAGVDTSQKSYSCNCGS